MDGIRKDSCHLLAITIFRRVSYHKIGVGFSRQVFKANAPLPKNDLKVTPPWDFPQLRLYSQNLLRYHYDHSQGISAFMTKNLA
jgi:hypothetical protein